MTPAILRFACWEAAVLAAAMALAPAGFRRAEERLLTVIAIDIALEASFAGLFSFLGMNSQPAYWIAAVACAVLGVLRRDALREFGRSLARLEVFRYPRTLAIIAALTVPLFILSFKPVEEIDSMNYLHYLIEWMANRATPYTFATNYVAFWELSFLPAWMVTRVDLFFPLLALKAVVLLALAAWLAGRELGLRRGLLLWAVFGAVTLRHLWYESSGVPTLKNDALHGAGFAILAVVICCLRPSGGEPARSRLRTGLAAPQTLLLALGCSFVCVKYTGPFIAALAIAIVLWKRRAWRAAAIVMAFTLLTSGHYYIHNLLRYGSPFYPFQINFGPIHLPGTADLSATSILYSLRDPRTWQLLFLPEHGLSPAGLIFPITLVATLVLALRGRAIGLFLLAGWLLFFRSVYSASASPGDLVFLRSSLNTIRYVDGVVAVSELFLLAHFRKWPRLADALVALNIASRLWILYQHVPSNLFPPRVVFGAAGGAIILFLALVPISRRKHAGIVLAGTATALLIACPLLVERNRVLWTTYWNDLKPSLDEVRPRGLLHVALETGGYFAGHAVAAGNPVDLRVRSLLPEEITGRPPYLTLLPTPGSAGITPADAEKIAALGYRPLKQGVSGMLYELK